MRPARGAVCSRANPGVGPRASRHEQTVYVILDLEFPRQGLIQVQAFDQALVDLLESMK